MLEHLGGKMALELVKERLYFSEMAPCLCSIFTLIFNYINASKEKIVLLLVISGTRWVVNFYHEDVTCTIVTA